MTLPENCVKKRHMLIGQFVEHREWFAGFIRKFIDFAIYSLEGKTLFLGCNCNFARLVRLKFPEELLVKPIMIWASNWSIYSGLYSC